MLSKLMEGMYAGDLTDLVQPLVSIDEYDSKIDENSLVIGFYINDIDGADDLNRFIQKSPVPLIDCEVSPAPDQRGYYMVFVEFHLNNRVVSNVSSLLDEVSPLAGIEKWQMSMRGMKKMVDFTEETMLKQIESNKIKDKIKDLKTKMEKLSKDIQR